jgi:hypothetical protein
MMLEQLAQMFGLRESAFPPAAIGSPQQIQILGVIPLHPTLALEA